MDLHKCDKLRYAVKTMIASLRNATGSSISRVHYSAGAIIITFVNGKTASGSEFTWEEYNLISEKLAAVSGKLTALEFFLAFNKRLDSEWYKDFFKKENIL